VAAAIRARCSLSSVLLFLDVSRLQEEAFPIVFFQKELIDRMGLHQSATDTKHGAYTIYSVSQKIGLLQLICDDDDDYYFWHSETLFNYPLTIR